MKIDAKSECEVEGYKVHAFISNENELIPIPEGYFSLEGGFKIHVVDGVIQSVLYKKELELNIEKSLEDIVEVLLSKCDSMNLRATITFNKKKL